MGLYWATFICNGTYVDRNSAIVIKKVQVTSIDPVIESREWEAGVVSRAELEKLGLGTLENAEPGNDVFMSETIGSTLDPSDKTPPKYRYILVERNCRFVPKQG